MILHDTQKQVSRIQLLPNRSITWRQMCWVIASLGSLSLAIALFWALQGAWIIFPFAGLEIALLAYLSLRVTSNAYNKQVIYIDENEIRIEYGYLYPKKLWFFDRDKTQFLIGKPRHSLSASKVTIQDSTGQTLVLGETLNKDDIDQFIHLIKESNLPHKTYGSTRIQAMDEQEIFR